MRTGRRAGALALVVGLAAGCASGGDVVRARTIPQYTCGSADAEPPTRPEGGRLDKVTFLTALDAYGRDGYPWVAKHLGFFEEVGIEVDIQQGKGTTYNLGLLAVGRAQFAANDLAAVTIVLGNGAYREDVRAIAAIQQRTLNSVTVLASTGIKTPKDLSGRTIGGVEGAAPWLLFPAYAKLAKIDDVNGETVKWQPVQGAQMAGLLAAHKLDGIGQFVVARKSVEKAAGGRPALVLAYSDVLSDLYGNGLLTSTKILRENPDLARRFASALLKGLVYAVEHPDEAARILSDYVPGTDRPVAASELELMQPYVKLDGKVGVLDPDRVSRSIAILRGSKTVTGELDANELIASNCI